jgi:hypothetical protein
LTDTVGVGSGDHGDLGRVLDNSLRVRDTDGDVLTGLDVGVPNEDVGVLLTQVDQRNSSGVGTREDGQEERSGTTGPRDSSRLAGDEVGGLSDLDALGGSRGNESGEGGDGSGELHLVVCCCFSCR